MLSLKDSKPTHAPANFKGNRALKHSQGVVMKACRMGPVLRTSAPGVNIFAYVQPTRHIHRHRMPPKNRSSQRQKRQQTMQGPAVWFGLAQYKFHKPISRLQPEKS